MTDFGARPPVLQPPRSGKCWPHYSRSRRSIATITMPIATAHRVDWRLNILPSVLDSSQARSSRTTVVLIGANRRDFVSSIGSPTAAAPQRRRGGFAEASAIVDREPAHMRKAPSRCDFGDAFLRLRSGKCLANLLIARGAQ